MIKEENSIAKAINGVSKNLRAVSNELNPKTSDFVRIGKWIVIIIPTLFAYVQYLNQSVESRIEDAEKTFDSAMNQITSSSEAVSVAGIRAIYESAFKEMPIEPIAGWYSPALNLFHWVIGKSEFRFLDRARLLFKDYAKSSRTTSNNQTDLVSTAIIKIAIDWINKEQIVLNQNPRMPELWYLYKSKLPKAYAPSSNLMYIQMSEADLTKADLTGSDLSWAYLQNAKLDDAILEQTNLKHTNFSGSSLKNVKLNNSLLDSANFSKANLFGASLILVHAHGTDFRDAVLDNIRFRNSDLTDTDFRNASLKNAFIDADIVGSNFRGANLTNADLSQCEVLSYDIFKSAIIKNTKMPMINHSNNNSKESTK